MSDQRKPLVGWTYDPEPNHHGWHPMYDCNRGYAGHASADEIGIPAPRPPRTGTLGLSEEDVKVVARLEPKPRTNVLDRVRNLTIESCRADVARWDAEDAATATAVPDTLTVELPVEVVRYASGAWTDALPNLSTVGNACRAALENAGLS